MHDDVEEVFFILKGKMVALIQAEEGGEVYEVPLSDRDCISIPPNEKCWGRRSFGSCYAWRTSATSGNLSPRQCIGGVT